MSVLEQLLNPRSVAVIGASSRDGPGRRVISNLSSGGYRGTIYPVNPKHETILGYPSFPMLSDLPEPPDCVVVAIASAKVPSVLQEAVEFSVPAAVVLSSGFSEVGERGATLHDELRVLSEEILISGPNCMGFVNLVDGVAAYSGPIEGMKLGNLAIVTQSGAIGCALVNAVEARGIGLSHHISSGNGIGIGIAEYLEYLIDDPSTTLIALYLESLERGRDIVRLAAQARAVGKQVIVLHAGTSDAGRRAAVSHTGALTASAEVMRASCRDAGIVMVGDLDEMIQCIDLFYRQPLPPAGDVAIVTISGGEAALLADAAAERGLPLASFAATTEAALASTLPSYVSVLNPLDSTGAGIVERDTSAYQRALEHVGADPNVGLVVVAHDVHNGLALKTGENVMFRDAMAATAAAKSSTGTAVVVLSPTAGPIDPVAARIAQDNNIPIVLGTRSGIGSIAGFMAARQNWRVPEPAPVAGARTLAGTLTDHEALEMLERYGIESVRWRFASFEEEAIDAGLEIGFPVAVKAEADGLLHKSDIGGVRLDVRDERGVAVAYRELQAAADSNIGPSAFRGVLVQETAPAGVELLCGGRYDEALGPIIVLSLGGVFAELFNAPSIRLAPINQTTALEMISELRGGLLLTGLRGRPSCDIGGVAEALVAISQLTLDHAGTLSDIEINPLLAPFGAPPLALDALIVAHKPAPRDPHRTPVSHTRT